MQHAWESSEIQHKNIPLSAPRRRMGEVQVQLHLFLASAPDGSDWLISRPRPLYPRGKIPCTHSVVGPISAGNGPSLGFEFGIVDAVVRHSAVSGGIWNVQIPGHFPLRLPPAHNSSMTSFVEQSQQMPAIKDGVKSISRYISAKRERGKK